VRLGLPLLLIGALCNQCTSFRWVESITEIPIPTQRFRLAASSPNLRGPDGALDTDGIGLPAELESRLREYLIIWNTSGIPDAISAKDNTEVEEKNDAEKDTGTGNGIDEPPDFFSMFKPAGFYKDDLEASFSRRVNKETPFDPHPFAYVHLKRLGYADLTEEIMSLGGPLRVGQAMGLEWQPKKQIFDERLRPKEVTEYALDVKGSLSLGAGLDSTLDDAAEALDLTMIKAQLAEKQQQQGMGIDEDSGYGANAFTNPSAGITVTSRGIFSSSSGSSSGRSSNKKRSRKMTADGGGGGTDIDAKIPSYTQQQPSTRLTWAEVAEQERRARTSEVDRFRLQSAERAYLVAAALTNALAWGRATQQLLDPASTYYSPLLAGSSSTTGGGDGGGGGGGLIAGVQGLAVLLLLANIVSAGLSAKYAAERKQALPVESQEQVKVYLWLLRALLGGPLTLLQLQQLQRLQQL